MADENNLTSDEINAARFKIEIDNKMKDMIREILFYGLFLFLLLVVVDGQQDNNSFQQNQNIAYMFTQPCLNNLVRTGFVIQTIFNIKYP